MICGNCGQQNSQGAKFCAKCGSPLEQNFSQQTNTYSNTQNNFTANTPQNVRQFNSNTKTSGIKAKSLVLPVTIVVILLIALFTVFSLRSTPQKTVKKFFQSVNKVTSGAEFKSLLNEYTVDGSDKLNPDYMDEALSAFEKPENFYKLIFYFKGCKIISCQKDKNTADIEFDVQTRDYHKLMDDIIEKESSDDNSPDKIIEDCLKDKSTATITCTASLEKVNGKWKINDTESFIENVFSEADNLLNEVD